MDAVEFGGWDHLTAYLVMILDWWFVYWESKGMMKVVHCHSLTQGFSMHSVTLECVEIRSL